MNALPNLFDDATKRRMIELYAPRCAQIGRAEFNAEQADDTFADRADEWICHFASTHDTFTASRCTNAARLAGLESPAHGAWGSRFIMAQRNGVIHRVGYAQRKNGNPAPLYAACASEGLAG